VNPGGWTLIIAAVVAAGGIIGTITSRIGKRGDQELETVRDQFARLIAEVDYWKATATEGRGEWEGRWDRQMVRCRKVTDALVVALAQLLRGASAEDREAAERALQDLREHNDADH
jgi:hypothetical protein